MDISRSILSGRVIILLCLFGSSFFRRIDFWDMSRRKPRNIPIVHDQISKLPLL
jgi:hypothetical protein